MNTHIALLFCFLLSGSLLADDIVLPKVGKPQFIDMEADTNVNVCVWREGAKSVTVTVACDGVRENAMRIIFGTDKNKDGKLGFEEYGATFGWDAGEWISEGPLGENRIAAGSVTKDKRKICSLTWLLNADGSSEKSSMKEGECVLGGASRPSFDKGWNLVRIVRNGVLDPNEKIILEVK